MKKAIQALVLALPVVAGCSSASSSEPAGTPRIGAVEEAIAFAVVEENLLAYDGAVFGSEHFEVELPSGAVTDNWTINCYFGELFRPFGTDAFDELAPLLDHEHEFVQIGAYSVLNSYMNKHGLKRHARQSDEERVATMRKLQEILDEEGI